MGKFQYEWWTVDIVYCVGKMKTEFKGKNKESVIRQIKKEFNFSNSEENLSRPVFKQHNIMKEVLWDTLELDRVGYQRLY